MGKGDNFEHVPVVAAIGDVIKQDVTERRDKRTSVFAAACLLACQLK
ncbi:hypothetical protein SLEP1_g56582 [Rubroshorea leprosula]|uniref:Uncharacterized protein n=1 Tax=Rubroshorea leprosula TaxID=152421 RepID=A0AAV5MIX8_9ROSI|nr:hypothetical protein SLEP1_g56582 [Rubroshorea leprosula]